MSPNSQEALSILALDIGTANTRALLFDVVEESYHFIAAGITPSTYEAPISDISSGVLDAIKQLQEITGRILVNQKSNLIIPSQAGGEGVDRLFLTYSAGSQLKIATFGLMNDISLQSINKLAATLNGKIVQSISINDHRTIHDQIDETLISRPDLILFAGGTDRGATRSVKKMANLIAAIVQLFPQEQRPPVIYSGNQLLVKPIKEILEPFTKVTSTVNVRPEMDNEELDQAAEELSTTVTQIRLKQIGGLAHLTPICSDAPCPSAIAIGRIVRFLSKVGDPEKGILAIDLGAGSTSTASAFAGKLELNVLPFGSAHGFENFLKSVQFNDIAQWFPPEIQIENARDQLWQKTLFPGSLPVTQEGLIVEQAAVRQMLRTIMRELAARGALVANGYESIILSGSALTQLGSPAQLLLMILDGLQPKGISTIILDSHAIIPALGAAARIIPIMPVQVLETTTFTNLATVISVVSSARTGTSILQARLVSSDKKAQTIEVKQGNIIRLPLKIGETATLELQTTHDAQIEALELSEASYKVKGGLCGLVIDARGRPLKLPANITQRGELINGWYAAISKG